MSDDNKLTDAEKAAWFPNTYGPGANRRSPYESVLSWDAKSLANLEGWTAEQERAYKDQVAQLCQTFGMDEGRAGSLSSLLNQYSRAPKDEEAAEVRAAERQEWAEKSRSIVGKWDNGAERLERGIKWIAENTDLGNRLNHTGVGNHPLLVEAVVDGFNRLGDE